VTDEPDDDPPPHVKNSVEQVKGPLVQIGRANTVRVNGGNDLPLIVIAVLVAVGAAALVWVVWLLGSDRARQGAAGIGTSAPASGAEPAAAVPKAKCPDGGDRAVVTAPNEITHPEYSIRYEVRCAPEPGHEYHAMIEYKPSLEFDLDHPEWYPQLEFPMDTTGVMTSSATAVRRGTTRWAFVVYCTSDEWKTWTAGRRPGSPITRKWPGVAVSGQVPITWK
jgi:hypothetical protein